jgi:ABC-type branched-subunit amino acid transport system substrate-binding protein
VWSKSDDEGAFLAQVFKNRGYESAALVTVQDDWQSSVSDAFQSAMKRLGMKIVSSHEELPGESDFRSILLKIKTAAPKAVFANLGVQQIAGFLRQAKDLGLATQIYSNFWVAKKDVLEAAGVDLLDGVRFIEMDTDLPSLKKFIWEKYSATPSGATLSAYASMLLLLQAVSQKPGILSKEALYQELVKQTEISTPDGAIRIIDRRVQFPLKEKLLKAGKVVLADGA